MLIFEMDHFFIIKKCPSNKEIFFWLVYDNYGMPVNKKQGLRVVKTISLYKKPPNRKVVFIIKL